MTSVPRLARGLRAAAASGACALLLTTQPATANPARHAHHDPAPAATATAPPSESSMFVVADPRRPRIARGPSGPLWRTYQPRPVGITSMGATFAQRYLAAERSRRAARTAKGLTTSQATKRLSKRCQRLVQIKKASELKKLRRTERRARTKCLEQRRKIIADSKRDPAAAPTPGAPQPAAPAPTPNAPTPTTPAPAAPAPTTPTPTAPTTPTPCTNPGPATVTVTAIDEGRAFELSACGAGAGHVTFTFNNTDGSEDHNLVLADGVSAAGGPNGTVRVVSANIPGGETRSKTFALTAGDYVLICTVEGHGAMTVPFKVF